jgi:hypothetical protein
MAVSTRKSRCRSAVISVHVASSSWPGSGGETADNPEMLKSVLVVTALLSKPEIDRANSYGICGIITKPFDVEFLLVEVKKCAGDVEGSTLGNVFCSSTPMILFIADLLRQRLG